MPRGYPTQRGLLATGVGLRQVRATPSPPAQGLPGAKDTYNPFATVLPPATEINASFTSIDVPGGFTAGASQAGVYPLVDLKVSDRWGDQSVSLFGVTMDMVSTNNADANPVGAGEVDWGSAQGLNAAIVIARNLWDFPSLDEWITWECPIPGVSDATIVQNDTRWLFKRTFPPGSYNDAIPFKGGPIRMEAPYVHRFLSDDRIQVGLCINGPQLQSGAGNAVVGFADVTISLGLENFNRFPES